MSTSAQAMKEKNRVLNSVKKTKEKLNKYNQNAVGNERPYDVKELYNQLLADQGTLVKIKTAIHVASEPMRSEIFEQSELKDRLAFMRNLPNTNGIIRDRYSANEGHEVDSVYGPKEIDGMTETLEGQINDIQDKLDKFNHTTKVSL